MLFLQKTAFILMVCGIANGVYAQPAKTTTKMQPINASELAKIRVTKYELALVQVLAEICPKMLNANQRVQFFEAYRRQLRAFIPNTDNPEKILEYLTHQKDYRTVLQNVRAWTASFPVNENRQICVDFANVSRKF